MTIVDPSGQGVNGELYEGAKGRRSFRSLNRHSTSPLSPSISRSPLYVSRTLSRIGSLLSVCVDRYPRSIFNSARFSPFPKARSFSFVPRSLETCLNPPLCQSPPSHALFSPSSALPMAQTQIDLSRTAHKSRCKKIPSTQYL